LTHLLNVNPNIDAVFACNDQMALGVLRAAAKNGINIPEDLALVGYDNLPEAEFFCSPLTTVRQNFSDQGRIMVDEIERRIRERQLHQFDSPKSELLQPELVIRESSIRIV
jgi:LacI family transcriptional regulator